MDDVLSANGQLLKLNGVIVGTLPLITVMERVLYGVSYVRIATDGYSQQLKKMPVPLSECSSTSTETEVTVRFPSAHRR